MVSRRATITRTFLLPGLVPRFWDLFGSGFSHLALYMAHAYRTVRLLPQGHPYLRSENIGKFGIWHVIREARKNLIFDREHLDQVIIYYVMFVGLFLLFFQILLLLISLSVKGAAAAALGAYWKEFFHTPNNSTDIAFQFIDRVFCLYGDGAAPLFNSNVVGTVHCSSSTQIHQAIHSFFYFYNVGVVAVAIIIGLYTIATVVSETAQSGIAFGRRFNKGITPIRLILAVSLLVPFSYGFNGAQHLTFRAAKWGSGLATNGWARYVCAIEGPCAGMTGSGLLDSYAAVTPANVKNSPLGTEKGKGLVAKPNFNNVKGTHEFNGLLEFIYVMHTCRHIELWVNRRNIDNNSATYDVIKPYQIYYDEGSGSYQSMEIFDASAPPGYYGASTFLSYPLALSNAENDDEILIRIGIKSDEYKNEKGNVYPICGEITTSIKDLTSDGAMVIQEAYWNLLVNMLLFDPQFIDDGRATAARYTPTSHKDPFATIPDAKALQDLYIDYYQERLSQVLPTAVTAQENDPEWVSYNTETGWAGAALWFNKISQLNGSLSSSLRNVPVPSKWPSVMEWVKEQRKIHDAEVASRERFNPHLSNDKMVEFLNPGDLYISTAEYHASTLWKDMYNDPEANPAIDLIRAFLGTEGLFNMMDNVDVHPLVQLTAVGRSLIESAVMNFSVSFGTGILGIGLRAITDQGGLEGLAKGISEFSMQIAMIGLSLGFILYYVVPFLPFIYFFFAVGGWIKSIFEAMVGLPLWALAHIRIDGEGIPGPAAMNGYYLIFEIFLRPILIIFGLIAALAVFSAQVSVLHHIWGLVISNVAGTDPTALNATTGDETGAVSYFRGAFDQFMYTVIYTIIVFMMGMGSFKMIDFVPNQILRWIGGSVSTIHDAQEDAAQAMVSYMHMGSQKMTGQLSSGFLGMLGRN